MTANGIFILCLFVGIPLVFGLWGLWTQGLRHRHELRLQRLQLLQEALRRPDLDEPIRRELLLALGREHRGPWRLAYGLYLGLAWCGFVIGGAYCTFYAARGWNLGQLEPALFATLVSFALLTLPFAVRELLGRSLAPAAPR